jgi:MtN3 and saliva related transmembrane protein
MSPFATEFVGFAAATLTSLCWLPQAWRTIRTRDTRAISLWTQLLFACGVALWLGYGLLILSWPVTIANTLTLAQLLLIIAMKLRFG